jgi:hypothetical protein
VTVFQIVRWAIQEEQLEPVAPILDRPAPGSLPLSESSVVAPPVAVSSNGNTNGAWWRDLRGSWRTLMAANDPNGVATMTPPAPNSNGHVPNGAQSWPSRDATPAPPGVWPDRPLDSSPPAEGYTANGVDHAADGQWSWVEAAAASWLIPTESDQPAPTQTTPPPPADDSDTPAPNA